MFEWLQKWMTPHIDKIFTRMYSKNKIKIYFPEDSIPHIEKPYLKEMSSCISDDCITVGSDNKFYIKKNSNADGPFPTLEAAILALKYDDLKKDMQGILASAKKYKQPQVQHVVQTEYYKQHKQNQNVPEQKGKYMKQIARRTNLKKQHKGDFEHCGVNIQSAHLAGKGNRSQAYVDRDNKIIKIYTQKGKLQQKEIENIDGINKMVGEFSNSDIKWSNILYTNNVSQDGEIACSTFAGPSITEILATRPMNEENYDFYKTMLERLPDLITIITELYEKGYAHGDNHAGNITYKEDDNGNPWGLIDLDEFGKVDELHRKYVEERKTNKKAIDRSNPHTMLSEAVRSLTTGRFWNTFYRLSKKNKEFCSVLKTNIDNKLNELKNKIDNKLAKLEIVRTPLSKLRLLTNV